MKMDSTMKASMLSAEMRGLDQRRDAGEDTKSKETAQEFEALLIRKVVEAMRKTIPEELECPADARCTIIWWKSLSPSR